MDMEDYRLPKIVLNGILIRDVKVHGTCKWKNYYTVLRWMMLLITDVKYHLIMFSHCYKRNIIVMIGHKVCSPSLSLEHMLFLKIVYQPELYVMSFMNS